MWQQKVNKKPIRDKCDARVNLESVLPNLVFLRFPIFAVKPECLSNGKTMLCNYYEMAKLISKKTEKLCVYEEKKSLVGSTGWTKQELILFFFLPSRSDAVEESKLCIFWRWTMLASPPKIRRDWVSLNLTAVAAGRSPWWSKHSSMLIRACVLNWEKE